MGLLRTPDHVELVLLLWPLRPPVPTIRSTLIKDSRCLGSLVYPHPSPPGSCLGLNANPNVLQTKPGLYGSTARLGSPTYDCLLLDELRQRLRQPGLHRCKGLSRQYCDRPEDYRPVGRRVCGLGTLEYVPTPLCQRPGGVSLRIPGRC